MKERIKRMIKETTLYKRLKLFDERQNEILKGLVFNNTISDSEWLTFKSFSPGEWAADYGLLYTIYRALSGMKPESIMEFGLGQSSKLVHQYSNYYHADAKTIEHDESWVNFFMEGRDGNYDINVLHAELESVNYKGHETLTYKDLNGLMGGGKFDFVVVDGPFGSEHYSRSQIIQLATNNLSQRFCIIMDDTERGGEQETVLELMSVLDEKKVEYCHRTYHSSKKHTLICSADLKFLTSL